MNKKAIAENQKLKLREELISEFIAYWINDNDYLDLMFNKLKELITANDDYHSFSIDEILFEALGISKIEGPAFISNYLYSGEIRDWIALLVEIKNHLGGKPDPNNLSLGSYIFESKTYIEDAILGLAISLSKEKIDSVIQDKLIPILQNFPWKINDFPKFYLLIVVCHGIINSKKSLSFLRTIIDEVDIFSDSFSKDKYGEPINDYFQEVRSLAIKALVKISDEDELDYLYCRFKNECSFKVKQVLFFEIHKYDLPRKLDEEIKSTKRYNDFIHYSSTDKKFLLFDFDEVYKIYLQ